MSLTIVSQPEEVSLVKNFMPIEITTDNYITTPGVAASLTLLFTVRAVATDTLRITVDGTNYTFTAAATDTETGLWMPVGGALSLTNWVIALVAALNQNDFLSNYYWVEYVATNKVKFTARNTGATYSLTHSKTGTITYSQDAITAGVTEVKNANFETVLQVFLQKTYNTAQAVNSFDLIGEFRLTPNSASETVFYIQSLIERWFNPTEKPALTAFTTPTQLSEYVKYYFFQYGERYGSPADQKAFYREDNLVVLNGGISLKDYGNIQFLQGILIGEAYGRFLTWRPSVRYITPTQHEVLYYCYTREEIAITVKLKVYGFDGDELVMASNNFLTIDPARKYSVRAIPVRFSLVSTYVITQGLDPDNVMKYEIYIHHPDDDQISEVLTFVLDRRSYLYSYEYMFKNSYGVYEFIVFHGRKAKSAAILRDQYMKFIEFDYESDDQFTKAESMLINEYMVGARMRNKEESDWFVEFLKTEDLYEIIEDVYHPMKLMGSDFMIYKDDINLKDFIIQLSSSFMDKSYSNA